MSGAAWIQPLPQPTPASQPFWDGIKAHQVRLQRCDDCAGWVFYPRLHCPHCASRKLSWHTVSGEGSLYTFTVARVPTLPEFASGMPQLLAVVALDQGPHINTTLVGVAPEDLAVGQRVRPVFDERPGSITLLRYTATGAAHPTVLRAVPDAAATPLSAAASAPPGAPLRQVSCRDLEAMRSLVSGAWSGWSNPVVVSQALIDQFAELSGDDYWIHTDPARARAESPFGTTIAHGMLVQSLASRLRMPFDYQVTGFASMVNYGSDRLRFAAPVPAGAAIHGRCRVKAVAEARNGVQLTLEIAIHVVGQERPSVLNEQVILYL